MEPENDGLEDDFPFQMGDLEVPAVNLPGCSFREANMAFFCSHSLGHAGRNSQLGATDCTSARLVPLYFQVAHVI